MKGKGARKGESMGLRGSRQKGESKRGKEEGGERRRRREEECRGSAEVREMEEVAGGGVQERGWCCAGTA